MFVVALLTMLVTFMTITTFQGKFGYLMNLNEYGIQNI